MAKKAASPKKDAGKENQDVIQQQQDASEKENNDANTTNNDNNTNADDEVPVKPKALKPVQDKEEGSTEKAEAMEQEEIGSTTSDSKKRKHGETHSNSAAETEELPTADDDKNVEASATPQEGNNNNDEEEDSKPAPKKSMELPPGIDLTKPIKRARTAYFIFTDDRRAEIQAKHKGEGVAVVAKELGLIWKTLPDAEKESYQEKAALEREQVAQKLELLQAAGIDLSTLPGAATSSNPSSGCFLILPVQRMRKICRLDPEVRGMSKEALLLVTKCTELMTSKLGIESVRVAQIQNRRKLLPDDIAQVCGSRERFLFLRDDVKDLVREQVVQKQKDKESNPSSTQVAATLAASNSKPLTAYFASAAK